MRSNPPPADSALSTILARALHDHWGWFLAEGIALTVLGLGAMILPTVAGVVATIALGWLLLMAGLVGLIATFNTRQAPGFAFSLLSALLALFVGAVLVWNPLGGVVTLTFVLTAYFIIDGILMIFLAIDHRRQLSGRWEWMLVNGIIDLILATIIIAGMPGTLVWVLGLMIGIDMLFGGGSLIAMALEARKPVAGQR
jgi:uncharacterized membrane protein HdeD (DUF308 family)